MLLEVPGDLLLGERVVEHEVGEEAAVLVGPRGIVDEVEAVLLERLPEQRGRQRMVGGVVLGEAYRHIRRAADQIVRIGMTQLHGFGKHPEGHLSAVERPSLHGRPASGLAPL